MGGATLQLAAYGAQDYYLTGKPQITFFKKVYRRHTNFAMESLRQSIVGTTDLSINAISQKVRVGIARYGDLVSGIHFQTGGRQGEGATLRTQSYDTFLLIDNVQIEIGGQVIDTIYGDWMVAYSELVSRRSTYRAFPTDVVHFSADGDTYADCSDPLARSLQGVSEPAGSATFAPGIGKTDVPWDQKIFIPLLFWFNNNPGLSIPLVALQYQNVNLIFILTKRNAGPRAPQAEDMTRGISVWVDYIFLDTIEREKFANNTHEYLISQHQRQTNEIPAGTIVNTQLKFNHPVKYIMWWAIGNTFINCPKYNAPLIEINSMLGSSWTLKINGTEQFVDKPFEYFQHFQPYQYWPTNSYGGSYVMLSDPVFGDTPGRGIAPMKNNAGLTGNVYRGQVPVGCLPNVYSFALRPAEHQPSGTCNFSRLADVQLSGRNLFYQQGYEKTTPAGTVGSTAAVPRSIKIYAENYNILRFMSGACGLAFSN